MDKFPVSRPPIGLVGAGNLEKYYAEIDEFKNKKAEEEE